MRREIKIWIETSDNKVESDRQVEEVQKIINRLINNYGLMKFEHIIGFWMIFKKAPNEFIGLAKSIAQNGVSGLARAAKSVGQIFLKVKKSNGK